MQSNSKLNQVKLPYGLKNGKLLHISEVSSGLACECHCAHCNARLVARKGNKYAHCFAHYQSDECEHALETALHLAAKRVLEESAQIYLPELWVHKQVSGKVCEQTVNKSGSKIVCEEQSFILEDIKLEHPLGQITPDVMATINDSPFLIEIAVTHFVDERKDSKLKTLKIPSIEIDLSQIPRDAGLDEIRKAVVNSLINKKWLFHSEYDAVKSQLKMDLQKELQDELDKIFRADQEHKQKENELKQKKIAEKKAALEKIKPSVQALESFIKKKENHLMIYSYQLPNLHIWKRAVSTMNVSLDSLPDYLNSPTIGENIFACDRRAWQSGLFTAFIYNKFSKYDEPYPISVHKMIEWCRKYIPLNKFVFKLWSNQNLLDTNTSDLLVNFDIYGAVREFARHLEKEGFLTFHYRDFYHIEHDQISKYTTATYKTQDKLSGITQSQLNLLFDDEQEEFQERAGILEFCNGLSRNEAEKQAYELVLLNL